MRLKDEQAAELRLWATGRLERLTDTDSNILADYAVQLLNGDTDIEDTRKDVIAGLQDFLLEDTAQFVAELFVQATSHHRPPNSVLSAPAASRPVTRSPLPISQAQSALRSAALVSNAPSGPRKRKYAQAHGYDGFTDHIGRHRVSKRGRRSGDASGGINLCNRGDRGRDIAAATDSHTQPVGLGIGSAPFNLPSPSTPPPIMTDFAATFPYMAAMMSAQGMMAKKGKWEPYEPKTPEEPEIDIETFKAEQMIKQQDHKTRIATLKANQSQKAILAHKTAEIEAKLAAEKAKLMAKPGGDKILAQISAEQEKKDAAGQSLENGIEADIKSFGASSDPLLRRPSSAQSDTAGYLGKNQVICRFFPNCTKRDCTFKHASASPNSDVLCKFFPNCAKRDCAFKHPDGSMSNMNCKYYPDCNNPRCGFNHPEGSIRSGGVTRVDSRLKNLLISGVSASFNNGADSMNMVRVAVMGISPCESIQLQSFHDANLANEGEEAHDGLVVTFAESWQADEVRKRLTMVGGVGRVKCTWYFGPIDGVAGGTQRTELEVDSVYGYGSDSADGDDVKMTEDVKADAVRIKDDDLELVLEEDWAAIS